jgi:maltooligosyltrehalose trehalohydrolase
VREEPMVDPPKQMQPAALHLDGLRLDVTHELHDRSARHFLSELTATVKASTSRSVLIIAEDARNDAQFLRTDNEGGYGLDAVWADDLHHHFRRAAAGDQDGHFASFSGSTEDVTQTIRQGWFFTGQCDPATGRRRGTDTAGLSLEHFVVALQNHDQVGNRAFGDRLHHAIRPSLYRALSALLLLAPEIPLLFMGQEWAVLTPFCYFTDHPFELGEAVAAGRRAEFAAFQAFADPCGTPAHPGPASGRHLRAESLELAGTGRTAACRNARALPATAGVAPDATGIEQGTRGDECNGD